MHLPLLSLDEVENKEAVTGEKMWAFELPACEDSQNDGI